MAFPLDVCETENEFVVKASLPGIKLDDVQVTIHGDTLTIRGQGKTEEEKEGEHWHLRERRFGTFQRASRPLHARRCRQGRRHSSSTGCSTLRVPKAEAAKPKKIKIGGAGRSVRANGPKLPVRTDRGNKD